jgi:hypothetical protein
MPPLLRPSRRPFIDLGLYALPIELREQSPHGAKLQIAGEDGALHLRLLPPGVSAAKQGSVRAASAAVSGLAISAATLWLVLLAWPASRWVGSLADLASLHLLVPVALASATVKFDDSAVDNVRCEFMNRIFDLLHVAALGSGIPSTHGTKCIIGRLGASHSIWRYVLQPNKPVSISKPRNPPFRKHMLPNRQLKRVAFRDLLEFLLGHGVYRLPPF